MEQLLSGKLHTGMLYLSCNQVGGDWMNWVKIIEDAIEYIEENITEDLSVGMIARKVNTSPFYFQKGFSMLCGYTVGEYVRMRRLSIAGKELISSDVKAIDLAMKYGFPYFVSCKDKPFK